MHFNDLDDLQSVVADELAREFDDLLQPRRLSLDDPVERIAAGCGAFINQALHDPAWGALIARGAAAMPDIARVARGRLNEDIRRAAAAGRLHDVVPAIAFEFVLGITVRTMQSAAEGVGSSQSRRPLIVAGILRAIGVTAEEAQELSSHLGNLVGRNLKIAKARQRTTRTRSKVDGGQSCALRYGQRPTLGRRAAKWDRSVIRRLSDDRCAHRAW